MNTDAMLLTKGCSPMPSSVLNVVSVKVILFPISIVFTFSIVYGCVCVCVCVGGGRVRGIKKKIRVKCSVGVRTTHLFSHLCLWSDQTIHSPYLQLVGNPNLHRVLICLPTGMSDDLYL